MSLGIQALKIGKSVVKKVITSHWKVKNKAISIMEHLHKPLTDTVELSSQTVRHSICPSILKLRLDKKTIQSLMDIKDNNKLVEQARNIFCDRLGIPTELRPNILWVNNVSLGKSALCYYPAFNQVEIYEIGKKFLEKGKTGKKYFISFLGHELEHCRQNMQILSTPGLSDKVIHCWAQDASSANAKIFVNNLINLPVEEIEKSLSSGKIHDISLPFVKKILALKKQNATDFNEVISEITQYDLPTHQNLWKELQKLAKEHLIPIYPGTKEAKESEKLFKSFTSAILPTRIFSLDYWKYKHRLTEQLAYKKQYFILSNLLFDS